MATNNLDFLNNDINLDGIDPALLASLATGSESEAKSSSSLFERGDMVKLIEKYNEVDLPEDFSNHRLKKQFWAVLSKDIKLTFLESDFDLEEFEYLFNDAVINYLMNTPTYEYNFEDEQYIDQFRLYFLAALRRSKGFAAHRFNERIIEGGTINQTIRSNTDIMQSAGGNRSGGIGGFFKNLF